MRRITIRRARTWHYRKIRPCIEQSNGPVSLSLSQSCPDCIINTSGYDFRKAQAPRYLIRDRDQVYGAATTRRLRTMGIRDKPIAPGSPWQNGFAERLIGSIRRECVDHIVVLGETHLRRVLKSMLDITMKRERTGRWTDRKSG